MTLTSKRRGNGVVVNRTKEQKDREYADRLGFVQYGKNSTFINPAFRVNFCIMDRPETMIPDNPEHIAKWTTPGAKCDMMHHILYEIQQTAKAGYITNEQARQILDSIDNIQSAYYYWDAVQQMERRIRLHRLQREKIKEEEKKLAEINNRPSTYRLDNPASRSSITKIFPTPLNVGPNGDISEFQYTRPQTEAIFSHITELAKQVKWEPVLDILPPLQWRDNEKTYKVYVEPEKGGHKNRTRINLLMDHPEMYHGFYAQTIIQDKDGRVLVSGKEIVKKDGKTKYRHRLVPIEELSYDGIDLVDYIKIDEVFKTPIEGNNDFFTGEDEVSIEGRDDVYLHSGFGFVTVIRETSGNKVIIRKLTDLERELVGTKFHVHMDMHTRNFDKDPGEIGINVVDKSEIIKFEGWDKLKLKSTDLYQVCNVRIAGDDKEADLMARQVAKGLDEFVYVIRDLPLQPKLDTSIKVPLRDRDGNIIYMEKDGVREPILIHPQRRAEVEMHDTKLGIVIKHKVSVWEPPSVLVIGEQTGKLSVVPASWLYKITGTSDHVPVSKTRCYDKKTKKIVTETKSWPEVPSVCAWEDRSDLEHHLFTLKRKAKGLGRPESGSFSILPKPAPGADYRDNNLPIREKFVNFEQYRWENPNGRRVEIISDSSFGFNPGDMSWDPEWQFRAHSAGEWVEEASIAQVVAIEIPTREEVLGNTNQEAWYWKLPPATAIEMGMADPAVSWTNPAVNGIIATVACTIDGQRYSYPVTIVTPGEIAIPADNLTREQQAFLLRFVSYKRAEARLMAKASLQ